MFIIDPPNAPTNISYNILNSTSFNLQWSTPVTNGDCDIVKYYIFVTPGDIHVTLSSIVNETTVTVNGTGSYTVTVSGTDSLYRPIHTS